MRTNRLIRTLSELSLDWRAGSTTAAATSSVIHLVEMLLRNDLPTAYCGFLVKPLKLRTSNLCCVLLASMVTPHSPKQEVPIVQASSGQGIIDFSIAVLSRTDQWGIRLVILHIKPCTMYNKLL